MGALVGVIVGSIILFIFRKATKIVIPFVYIIGTILSIFIGVLIEYQFGGKDGAALFGGFSSSIVMVGIGLPLLIYSMILVLESKHKELENRVRTIEQYLQETTSNQGENNA